MSRAHFQNFRRSHRSQLAHHAASRRFFATVEALEPRHLLTIDVLDPGIPIGYSSPGQYFQPMKACTFCDMIAWVGNSWAAASDWLGTFEGQTGDLSVNAKSSGSISENAAYLPSYSTREQRSLLASVNVTVPAATTWTSLELVTTFDSVPGATRYFDPSGLAALDTFPVADLLDVTGLPPGRYPFHMDFEAEISGGGTDVFDYDGFVLVAGPSDSLMSPGWRINGLDRLSFDAAGALWETGDGELYWFAEDTGTYAGSAADLNSHTLVEDGGEFTITDRFGNSVIFDAAGLVTDRTDRFGNNTHFVYTDADGDSATDDISEIQSFDGTSLTFTYDTSSPYLLESITDFDGRTVTIGYDGGVLETLTFPDPGANGDPLIVGYTYNGDGLLETVTEGVGAGDLAFVTEFTYDPVSWALTTLERPDGTVENYTAAWPQGLGGTLLAPATPVLSADVAVIKTTVDGNESSDLTTAYYLGAFGRVKQIVDPQGNITAFTLDSYGRVTKRTDPDPDFTAGAGDRLWLCGRES